MMEQTPILSRLLCLTALCWAFSNAIAKSYTVGGSSGWDISTDLNSWAQDKTFLVGDDLVFMFSSTHSLEEVTKKVDYDNCNGTAALSSFTDGNVTISLATPGSRYFVCGNKLHCFSGMKLQVNVQSNDSTVASAAPSAIASSFRVSSGSPPSMAAVTDSLIAILIGFLVASYLMVMSRDAIDSD